MSPFNTFLKFKIVDEFKKQLYLVKTPDTFFRNFIQSLSKPTPPQGRYNSSRLANEKTTPQLKFLKLEFVLEKNG
jgi:hypothetical protein